MIRINLLPHREMRRRQQQQQFFVMLGGVLAIGAAMWFAVHGYLGDRLSNQEGRNQYLKGQIALLDKQIDQIKKLKEQTAALLARKKVVETLQSNRSEVVHLLDQLARQVPSGIYLHAVKQQGNRVSLDGYTQSQARVSTLMRNVDASEYLENPDLVEIKAVSIDGKRLNEFTMNVTITQAKGDEDKEAPPPKARPKG